MTRTEPHTGSFERKQVLISAVLFAISLVPRLVGLGSFLTVDEIKWIEGAAQFTLALQSGDLARTYWHFHPGITITWGEVLLLWLGWLQNGGDLAGNALAQVADPARTIGQFRLSGALLTSFFVPGVYWLGRRLWGDWVAALAGGLIALNPFLLAHSRIVNGDAGTAGLMLMSSLAFAWMWYGSGLHLAALSGALGGLAFLTKLPSPLVLPVIGLMAVFGWWRDRRTTFWLKALLIWGLTALLVFVILWPAMWVEPVGTLQQMWRDMFEVGEVGEGHSTFYRGQVVDDPGWGFYPYAVAFRLTPVVLIGLILVPLAMRRDGRGYRPADLRLWVLMLVGYILFIYVFGSLSPKKLDRYVMAVFPALDVLAAIGFLQLRDMAPQKPVARLALWVLIVGLLAVAFVIPNHPYYLTYYNPLLGGIERAVREVPVGWGEGLEQAAAWLNTQPGAQDLGAAAWYSDIFFPYFVGEHLSFSSNGKSQLAADYVVFYVNQVQRQKPYSALVTYFQDQAPAHTVRVKGVPWAWVYRAPGMRIAMPGDVSIEGRAELLGVDLPTSSVMAGQVLPARLYLRSLGPMPDNEAWRVSLISADGQAVLSDAGRIHPWTPDAIYDHNISFSLPGDMPSGAYSLEISLWDEAAGREVAQFPIPPGLTQVEVVQP